jgi:hypothetical protein
VQFGYGEPAFILDSMRAPDNDFEFDEELERDFPLGDGTADTEAAVGCPYCGETVFIALDPGGGEDQEYVEDCQVCCQPWRVAVTYRGDGSAEVSVSPLDA